MRYDVYEGSALKVEFKFLCSTYEACTKVKEKLKEIGFTDFKDLDKSPSFDIRAKFELKDLRKKEKIADKVLEQCKGKVQTIEINV